VGELVIMTGGQLQALLRGNRDQPPGLFFVDRHGLLDVDMASPLEA
jgi:hypothetical protein